MSVGRLAICLVLSVLLGACTAPRPDSEVQTSLSSSSPQVRARVCDIRARRDEFLGTIVLVDVTYVTDSSQFAYVEDPRCAEQSRMSLRFSSNPPESVAAFFSARQERCRSARKNVCIAEASLTATATVMADPDGILMLDLVDVTRFEFTKP